MTGPSAHGDSVRNRCKLARGPLDALGQILRIALFGLPNEQAAEVLLASGSRFSAPKQGRKFLMEGGKAGRHAFKLVQIHGLSSMTTVMLSWRLFYLNNPSL